MKVDEYLGFAIMSFLFCIFLWGIIDTFFLIRLKGKIKRGVKIYSEPLPLEYEKFLQKLKHDVVEKTEFFNSVKSFIIKRDKQILIQSRMKGWSTSWPYVAYINLERPNPSIEYRGSLPMHLLLAPFIITIIPIPFVLLGMYFNYRMEKRAINNFIKKRKRIKIYT